MSDDLIFTGEIARIIGVTTQAIRTWHKTGRYAAELPMVRLSNRRLCAKREDAERFAATYNRKED